MKYLTKLISHRGNTEGPNPERENKKSYIQEALDMGYDVEIDVWNINKTWFLGHDYPSQEIDIKFLMNNKLLCHAKNLAALDGMLIHTNIHCFYHADDPYTITSRGYIVSYPGYEVTPRTICMKPELARPNLDCYGICSDYIGLYSSPATPPEMKKFEEGYYQMKFNEKQ
tara:strand:+ start:1743 stop:2252 length:510 start_codon:yes stop_codon:yes gene_type:complete